MRSSRAETAAAREFEEYLIIAHYYSVRAACHGQKSLVKKTIFIDLSRGIY